MGMMFSGRYGDEATLFRLAAQLEQAAPWIESQPVWAQADRRLDQAGLVVEPSAALGIAAVLEDRDRFAGRHVATIVCGSNVDADAYRRWTSTAPGHRAVP